MRARQESCRFGVCEGEGIGSFGGWSAAAWMLTAARGSKFVRLGLGVGTWDQGPRAARLALLELQGLGGCSACWLVIVVLFRHRVFDIGAFYGGGVMSPFFLLEFADTDIMVCCQTCRVVDKVPSDLEGYLTQKSGPKEMDRPISCWDDTPNPTGAGSLNQLHTNARSKEMVPTMGSFTTSLRL